MLFGRALEIALAALVLIFCLFADSSILETNGVIGSIRAEATAIFRDHGTQWMVFLCLATNFLTFLVLQCRMTKLNFWRIANPDLWLTGVLLLGALVYAFSFSTAAQSTQALMLLAGAVLSSGMAVWSMWRQKSGGVSMTRLVIITLVMLLLATLLWHINVGSSFEYHGQTRWGGAWRNPNIYGLLIGVGMVLATGLLFQSLKPEVQSQKWGGQKWKVRLVRWFKIIFFLTVAITLSIGLIKSYSRGAWVAVICGLAYLLWWGVRSPKSEIRSRWTLWIEKNWFPLSTILITAIILCFWQFQHTEHKHVVTRRVFSVANVNDFSWRNRVAAWEGVLQIMAERPVFGAGWNQPERMYDDYYRPTKIEGAAIQLNSYFILGATLGVPALFFFGMYIWLSLSQKSEVRSQKSDGGIPAVDIRSPTSDLWRPTCRAGAIVLLVGFWFDGGLFYLPTAFMFWILLGLGAARSSPAEVAVSLRRP